MMKFKIIILIAIMPFYIGVLSAQIPKKSPKKDDTTIIVFDESDRAKNNFHKSSDNIVKISPISFVFGYIPLEYERKISSNLSLQCVLGLAFQPISDNEFLKLVGPMNIYNDYFYDISDPLDIPDAYPRFGNDIGIYPSRSGNNIKNRSKTPSISFGLSSRIYFDNAGMKGQYIAPTLRYGRDNLEVNVMDGFPTQKESIQKTFFSVRYGYQSVLNKFILDSFVGFGIGSYILQRLDARYENLSRTNIVYGSRSFKSDIFLIEIGTRVGFSF
jgi:hypothetical protein